MNNRYLQTAQALLAKYNLTLDDCTSDEIDEMLEEAHDLENDVYSVLDGYFGGTTDLFNIEMRKSFIESELKKKGLSLAEISPEEYNRLKEEYHNKMNKL